MKQPNISPEKYHEILERIELREICLIESKSKVDEANRAPKLELIINDKNTFSTSGDEMKVISRYAFKAKAEDLTKPFVEIVVKFQLVFDIRDNVEVTKDFFDVYEELTLGFMVWPYFREYVQNILNRMNLPPLTLPMRKAVKE